MADKHAIYLRQIPAAVPPDCSHRPDQILGGLVRNEMHRQFARQMQRRFGTAGDIAKDCADIVQPPASPAAIALPQHRLGPRLCPKRPVCEPLIMGKTKPGQQFSQFPDVVLVIAGVNAQRMQLQRLAGEVLVQPEIALGPLLGKRRIRSAAGNLVQIDQHHRMGIGSKEHIFEPAIHMGTDRLVHESHGQAVVDFVDRANGEVVAPELHESFAKPDGIVQRTDNPAAQVLDGQNAELPRGLLCLGRFGQLVAPGPTTFVEQPSKIAGPFGRHRTGVRTGAGGAGQHSPDIGGWRHQRRQTKAQTDCRQFGKSKAHAIILAREIAP